MAIATRILNGLALFFALWTLAMIAPAAAFYLGGGAAGTTTKAVAPHTLAAPKGLDR